MVRSTFSLPIRLAVLVGLVVACTPAAPPSPTAAPAQPAPPVAAPAPPTSSPAAAAAPPVAAPTQPTSAPAAAAVPAAPAASPASKPGAPLTRVKLGLPTAPPTNTTVQHYFAVELGYFKDVGLDVEITEYPGTPAALR